MVMRGPDFTVNSPFCAMHLNIHLMPFTKVIGGGLNDAFKGFSWVQPPFGRFGVGILKSVDESLDSILKIMHNS